MRKSNFFNFLLISIMLITCTIGVQAQGAFDPTENLALRKPAFAGGGDAANANDGNNGNQWQTSPIENEWWYVDLGAAYNVNEIQIRWESAYSKTFELYTAIEEPEEGQEPNWELATTISRTLTSANNYEEVIPFLKPARYIKFKNLERALPYGAAIREFRVFGIGYYNPVSEPELTSVEVRDLSLIQNEEGYLAIFAKDQGGNLMSFDEIEVTSDSEENVEIRQDETTEFFYVKGLFGGTYELTAKVTIGGITKTGTSTLTVVEPRRPAKIHLNRQDSVWSNLYAANSPIALTVKCIDQYGDLFTTPFSWRIDGDAAGAVAGTNYTPAKKGTGIITAFVGDVESEPLTINVATEAPNIALRKTVIDNLEGSTETNRKNAVDGNFNSTWAFPDVPGANQIFDAWMSVDLGAAYDIELIEVIWEGAYSKTFTVDYSMNGEDYETIYNGGNSVQRDSYNRFSGTEGKARYVRIFSTQAGTGWGVKIRELSVYGTEALVFTPELTTVTIDDAEIVTGQEVKLVIQAKDQDGVIMTPDAIAVTSNPEEGVEIRKEGDDFYAKGLVEGAYELTATVTVGEITKEGTATLTVNKAKELNVSMSNATIAAGEETKLIIAITDEEGELLAPDEIAVTSNPEEGVEIRKEGNDFYAKGLVVGTYELTATVTVGDITEKGTATLTVNKAKEVNVTLANAEVIAGDEVKLSITVKDENAQTVTPDALTVTSNPSTGVEIRKEGNDFYVKGLVVGTYELIATVTVGDITEEGTATLTVNKAKEVNVTLANAEVIAGDEVKLSITVKDENAQTVTPDALTVTSNPSTGVEIRKSGNDVYVKGLTVGTYELTATATVGGITNIGKGTLTVKKAKEVNVTLANAEVFAGDEVKLSITVKDENAQTVTPDALTVTSNPSTGVEIRKSGNDVYVKGLTVGAYELTATATVGGIFNIGKGTLTVKKAKEVNVTLNDITVNVYDEKVLVFDVKDENDNTVTPDDITITSNSEKFVTIWESEGNYYVKATQAGVYELTIEATVGSLAGTDKATLTVESSSTRDTDEFETTNIVVFPNPATDYIKISGNVAKVTIYNLQGKLIMTQADVNEVNISGLAAGLYIVKVADINEQITSTKIKVLK